jgi:cyclopropane-fatty-acyl-phospholipid synthase
VPLEIYRLFLDDGLNYSCRLHRGPAGRDARAGPEQQNPSEARPAGWHDCGRDRLGLGLVRIHLAGDARAPVTAINVSPAQLRVARERARAAGVPDRVAFVEMDYRNLSGCFGRVVSVGMMEHVGIGHFDGYFGKIRSLLT